MKKSFSRSFLRSRAQAALSTLLLVSAGTLVIHADSPTDSWSSPNSNLLKGGNWSTGNVPAANVIGVINDAASTNGHVLGLDVGGTPPTTAAGIGLLDLTGGTNELVGTYNSGNGTTNNNLTLTLLGATLNNTANTVIANENSGTTFTFQNDAQPSNKNPNTGTLTLALGNTANVIQSSGAGNNIVINSAISGSGDSLAFLGSGTGSLSLNAADTYSGGTQVSSGFVVAGNAAALGTGAVTVGGGSLKTTVSSLNLGSNLTLSSGAIVLNSATFNLTLGHNYTQSGGTLDLTSGSPGAIDGSGTGTFSFSGGTLDLGGNAGWNYSHSYDLLNGFAGGSVSNLNITDYDSTDYTATLSNSGVLSFAAVPEPRSWLLAFCAVGLFGALLRSRRAGNTL